MILVTVGTHTEGFDRLVVAADLYAASVDETVTIQRGSSKYVPVAAKSFQWSTHLEMDRLMEEARVVISHAGAGTIIQAMKVGKPLMIAPRQAKYHEHRDDHQLQLARALAAQGRVLVLEEVSREAIRDKMKSLDQLVVDPGYSRSLIAALRSRLGAWSR